MGIASNLAAFARSILSSGKIPGSAVASRSATTVILTGSGNWACPADVTAARVTVIGAGNVGGASGTTGVGAGAGAGGRAIKSFTNLVPGTNYAYVAGATAGAASTFTGPSTLTGNGGAVGGSAALAAKGGLGGTATGGDFNIQGETGDNGVSNGTTMAIGGVGGSTAYGVGGQAGLLATTGQNAGAAAVGYGSGGGGSVAITGTNTTGGAFAPGAIIIEY